MSSVFNQNNDVHFGEIDRKLPDWREDDSLVQEQDPDDEVVRPTPPDVIAMLGFDPLEEWGE